MNEEIKPLSPIDKIEPIEPLSTQYRLESFHENSSTIEKTKSKEGISLSKPVLDPPNTLSICTTLNQLVNQIEPTINRQSLYKEELARKESEIIFNFQKELTARLEEAHQTSQSVSFWSLLEDISSSVMSGITFYIGTSALSSNPVIGGLLITYGVISIGNLVLKHGHVLDWVANRVSQKDALLHQAITTYVPPAIGIFSAAIGVFSSVGAWQFATETGIKQAGSIFGIISNIAYYLSHFASETANSSLKFTQAEISEVQIKERLSSIDLDSFIKKIKDLHQKQKDLYTTVNQILDEAEQTAQITLTQQPV